MIFDILALYLKKGLRYSRTKLLIMNVVDGSLRSIKRHDSTSLDSQLGQVSFVFSHAPF